jgi:tetratricopeptide (TPR) repeat protein
MKKSKNPSSKPASKATNPLPKTDAPLSKSKQRLFGVIAIFLPLILLVFLELVLRLAGYGDNFSLFVNHPDKEYGQYLVVNPDIGKKYFNKMEYSTPAKDMFLKDKPKDVFRIFAMGSSSVAGFPYENNLMFPRILSERLRDAYPDKKFEIINTAITAVNSFTLADFMPQILEQKPDAIIFYAGHNEFYGAFGVGSNEAVTHSPTMIRIHLSLLKYKVYQLTFHAVGNLVGLFSFKNSEEKVHGTLMKRMVKDADILYGSHKYKEGIRNYEENLDAILSMAKNQQVPVFISDLVSNLRDLRPFESIAANGLKGADEYYETAKKYDAAGDYAKAKENYVLARDYDCIRFRASSDINTIVRKMADKYQTFFVPTLDLFLKNSPNGIVGNNLLTEHLHPNIPGQFLLAESFYKEIVSSKLIAPEVNRTTEKSYNTFIKDYGYTNLDYWIGKHRVTNLSYHWPFADDSKGSVDYRQIYRPTGLVDSLAFTVMAKRTLSLLEAHEKLAERYFKSGDFLNAFKEYNALTKLAPYWSYNFRKAGDCLLQLNEIPKALVFFDRSREYTKDVFYAHYRSGEICTIMNNLESALWHFRKAQEVGDAPQKQKALIKIYQTLVYLNRPEEGKEIQEYFRKVNPGQSIPVPQRTTLIDYVPVSVAADVNAARDFLSKNKAEMAIGHLLNSLEIEETSIGYRLLGEAYLKSGSNAKAYDCLLKAYPDFQFEPKFLHYFIIANLSSGKTKEAGLAYDQLAKIEPGYEKINVLKDYISKANSGISSTIYDL